MSELPEPKTRDRGRTQGAILEAAKQVLAESGFAAWGVNAIARAAGCDKQLIYRYYGGLDGLAEVIGVEMAAWLENALTARPGDMPATDYAGLVARLLIVFASALRSNPLAQKIVAWEVAEASPLVVAFAAARGRVMTQWILRERGELVPPAGLDAPAVNALLIAGVQHLVLTASASGSFSGVKLEDDADWARIVTAVQVVAKAVYR